LLQHGDRGRAGGWFAHGNSLYFQFQNSHEFKMRRLRAQEKSAQLCCEKKQF
jgi:hypothetical protein